MVSTLSQKPRKEGAAVAHEDAGRMTIVNQEAQGDAGQRRGEVGVGWQRHECQGQGTQDRQAGREPVEPVDEVPGRSDGGEPQRRHDLARRRVQVDIDEWKMIDADAGARDGDADRQEQRELDAGAHSTQVVEQTDAEHQRGRDPDDRRAQRRRLGQKVDEQRSDREEDDSEG